MNLGLGALGFYLAIAQPSDLIPIVEPLSVPENSASVEREWELFQRRSRDRLERFLKTPAAEHTFENTFESIEALYADSWKIENWVAILIATHPSEEIRSASSRIQIKLADWWAEFWRDPNVFKILKEQSVTHPPAEQEPQALVREILSRFDEAGVDLKSETQEELEAYESKLNKLIQKLAENFVKTPSFLLLREEELKGIPLESFAEFRLPQGTYVLDLKEWWVYDLLRTYAQSDLTRQKAEHLWRSRAQTPESLDLVKAIIRLRQKIAKKSEYISWAARKLEDTEFSTPRKLNQFLNAALKDSTQSFRQHRKEMTALKREITGNPKARLEIWDLAYIERIQLERQMKMPMSGLREYFELNHTLQTTFNLLASHLSIEFVERKDIDRWDPDIQVYEVRDQRTQKALGLVYLDLFPRPDKDKWFFSSAMAPRRLISDTKYQAPVAYVSGVFVKAPQGQKTLLNLEEVTTIWHELGHALEELLTESRYSFFAGSHSSIDAAEVFSTYFERYAARPDTLRQLARHFQSGEPLPEHIIEALSQMPSAFWNRERILQSIIDLRVHQARPEYKAQSLYKEYYFSLPQGVDHYSSFSHLQDYDSTFWIYFWDSLLAVELESAESRGKTGLDLRQKLLIPPHGILSTKKLVEDYLGRGLRSCKEILKHL